MSCYFHSSATGCLQLHHRCRGGCVNQRPKLKRVTARYHDVFRQLDRIDYVSRSRGIRNRLSFGEHQRFVGDHLLSPLVGLLRPTG